MEYDYEGLSTEHSMSSHLMAGALAGITEHSVLYPIDLIKTRMQVLSAGQKNIYTSIGNALSQIYVKEGFSALWKGLPMMILGAGPSHALYFATYEESKRYLKFDAQDQSNAVWKAALSGAAATLASDAFMNPFDVIKQRMQIGYASLVTCVDTPCGATVNPSSRLTLPAGGQQEPILRYRSIWHCFTHTLRNEGIKAFYQSYPTTISISIPFQSIHFATYEYCKETLYPYFADLSKSNGGYSPSLHIVSGGVAGSFAALLTTPLDVSKTLLQTKATSTCPLIRDSKSLRDAVRIIYMREGLKGFMRGAKARMLGAMPSSGLSWLVYEFFKREFRPTAGDLRPSPIQKSSMECERQKNVDYSRLQNGSDVKLIE
ncbi:hypothetical protein MIR68_012644 [Amoeboaphelidium protococcarum]|nr:hypothetical protein MIR68_012644 [Amoeboaphelidium protococcarum]